MGAGSGPSFASSRGPTEYLQDRVTQVGVDHTAADAEGWSWRFSVELKDDARRIGCVFADFNCAFKFTATATPEGLRLKLCAFVSSGFQAIGAKVGVA